MRLLAVLALPPTPFHGAALRSYHFLRLLRERHDYEVRIVCLRPSNAPATEPALWDDVIEVRTPAGGTRAKWRWSLVQHASRQNLRSRRPAWLNPDYSVEMGRAVDAAVERWRPDVLFAGSLYCGRYVAGRDTPAVVDAIDAIPEGYRRAAAALAPWMRTLPRRAFLTAMRLAAIRELRYVGASPRVRVIATTAREAELLERDAPGLRVTTVTNGVDLEYFRACESEAATPTLLFTGALSAPGNRAAVRWFVEGVLPLVRQAVPDVRFVIVGAAPQADVLELHGRDGIEVHADVDDVRPFLAQSWAGVVPIRDGQGVSNKLLESMASGRPTVFMPAQMNGLSALDGGQVLVADDAPGFATACVGLLRDPGLRRRIGASARAYVEAHHDWRHETDRIEALFASMVT